MLKRFPQLDLMNFLQTLLARRTGAHVLSLVIVISVTIFTQPVLAADHNFSDLKIAQTPASGGAETEKAARELDNSQRQIELSQRLIVASQESVKLNNDFTDHVNNLLKAASSYDVENYRKLDDELADIMEKTDANYLEQMMLLEAQLQSFSEHDQYWEKSRQALESMKTVQAVSKQRTKLSTQKSSAIFYLCFGLPMQAAHSALLSLNIADANASEQSAVPDIAFWAGTAFLWSGDYKTAEEQLKRTIQLDPNHKYASNSLAEVYMAEGQTSKAIEFLLSARQRAANDEVRGNLDRLLAVAYSLNKQPKLAKPYIESARKALDNESKKEFAGVAKESTGIVAALAGDYELAERKLSEALPLLQLSPINLGMRLEAAQAALWRSYCRAKLGDKLGAAEDRKYALSISDEANHLPDLARMLDPLFGYKALPGPMPIGDIRDRWAVVVGVGSFADPMVPKLRYPAKDATDVQQFLVQSAGFKPDHVRLLLDSNATRATICDSISGQWLSKLAKPGDLVFLFVSSHGTPNYKEIGALNSLVTYDTKLDHLFSTSLPMQSVVRMIRSKLRRQHTFVVLDTCYSGGLGAPGEDAKLTSNADPELMVISHYQLLVSSSDSKERSWESKRYPNSVFTRQLLDMLTKNPRYDDFRSVFAQISEKVSQEVTSDFNNKQTPRLAGLWSGKGLIKAPTTKAVSAP